LLANKVDERRRNIIRPGQSDGKRRMSANIGNKQLLTLVLVLNHSFFVTFFLNPEEDCRRTLRG
jgi:hypothetical protein